MIKFLKKNLKKAFSFKNEYKMYDMKRKQKYLEREHNRRKFDTKLLERVEFNLRNVLNTGFNLNKMECYQFPFQPPKNKGMNTVKNSYLRVVIPFQTDRDLAELFIRFDNENIRVGKLLELMDFVSGRVCYQHLRVLEYHSYSCVTACVDNFDIFDEQYSVNENIVIDAYLTYVGKRAMEVQVDLMNKNEDLKMSVTFLYVTKHNPNWLVKYSKNEIDIIDVQSMKDKVKVELKKVPIIDIENDENKDKAQYLYYLGKRNQRRRIEESHKSPLNIPPKNDEVKKLHDLLINTTETTQRVLKMSESETTNYALSHVADRNIHNTTFGGILMRESFELGYITAYLNGLGERPKIYHINDTQFMQPVPFGSILKFTSNINYIYQNLFNILVTIDIIQKKKNGKKIFTRTNELNVTFEMSEDQGILIPETYKEAMLYVQGERKIRKLFI